MTFGLPAIVFGVAWFVRPTLRPVLWKRYLQVVVIILLTFNLVRLFVR